MGFIEGIILFIWGIIKFLFSCVTGFFKAILLSTGAITDFLGISYAPKFGPVFAKLLVFVLVSFAYSIVPDLITYYGCRLSKKYRELNTKEEKKEYASKHTHLALRAILEIMNKRDKKKAENVENLSNSLDNESILSENVDKMVQANIQNLSNNNENVVKDENKTNIKMIYSSNLIGNMLRKGTVLKRRFLASDKPVLIDFNGEPKEIFTNYSCSHNSGISFEKNIDGETVRMAFDDPAFLKNTKLFDDMSLEELKEKREELMNDAKYQAALKGFFTANDKAMKLKR